MFSGSVGFPCQLISYLDIPEGDLDVSVGQEACAGQVTQSLHT
jgi:hypothetical protein